MSSILTLNTPESRDTTTPVADVDQIQIAGPIEIVPTTRTLTFYYTKGYVSGSLIEIAFTSNTIEVKNDDYDAVMASAVEGADNVFENLTRVLLQYLIDKSLVGDGTINP